MKDFYGKTYKNTDFSQLSDRILYRMRSIAECFKQTAGFFSKRPVTLPAVLILLCSVLSYYFESVLPSIFVSVAVIFVFVCVVSKRRLSKVSIASAAVFLLMFCSVLIYLGGFIAFRLSASLAPDSGNEYFAVVTKVSADLSGNYDVNARLENGCLAKLRSYKDPGAFSGIDTGDRILIHGKLKEPEKAGNPGEFDYRNHLRSQGILYVINCDRIKTVAKARFPYNISSYLQRFFFKVRCDALEAVSGTFDKTYKALTAAVCLGDRSLVNDVIDRDFRMSCCSHLLAVSGTHFAGFLACLPMILNALRIDRKKAFILHVLFCIFIGFLTGWSDSVTRAAFMSICCFAERDWVSALSLASIVMTAADPFCPMSTGFRMSFCAVIAIKLYTERISKVLARLHIGGIAASLISPAVAASLGMIPFWSDISMRPDLLHLVVQIAGSFAAGITCTCFVPCIFLCVLLPFWSGYLSAPLLCCLKLLNFIVASGSLLSSSSGPPVHLPDVLLIVCGITIFLFMLPTCYIRRVFLKISSLVLAVCLGFEVFAFFKKPQTTIVFADVGQGDCCLILTSGKSCLIDAGTCEEGASTVTDLLDYYGISRVDICIMSHWDTDHAGGIASLFEQGRTGTIMTSFVPGVNDNDKDANDFFDATGIDKTLYLSGLEEIRAGDRIMLSGSVFIDVLYPYLDADGGNESSLVLMLYTGEDKILFTGDIGTKTESLLIESGLNLDCDILKVAHHGSKYSTSPEFLERCSPGIAVISVGANNFYGHPSPDTLARLESCGCDIFRTDKEGAVVLEY